MRNILQLAAPAPSPTRGQSQQQPLYPFTWGLVSNLDVKSVVLYVGLSLGVLILGLVLTCLIICMWLKPRRAQREVQRQRDTGLDNVKVDGEDFKPQVRPFPVLVMQPGSEDVVFASKEEKEESEDISTNSKLLASDITQTQTSLEDNPQGLPNSGSQTSLSSLAFFTPRGSAASSDLTEGRTINPSISEDPSSSGQAVQEEEIMVYNPLTHFLTDRKPRLFTADIVYNEAEEEVQQ